jgi:hypothetical protein
MGKSARTKRDRQAAMSRQQPADSGKPLPAGVSAAKSATQHVTPAKPEEFPTKKLINLTFIVSATALFGFVAIAARWSGDGAPGLIFIGVSVYLLTLLWDFCAKLMSVYGPVSIRNIHEVLLRLLFNYNVFLFFVSCLALFAAPVLILRSPSLASSFRHLAKRPSPRFGYRDMAEGLGDLAWTLAMISIAFGAAGSTSNLDWLVITGVFVPILINLRRQSYRDPRRVAAGSQRTEKE